MSNASVESATRRHYADTERRSAERELVCQMAEDAVHDQVGHMSACVFGLEEADECSPTSRQWVQWHQSIRGPDGLKHLEARELMRCMMADVSDELRLAALNEACRRLRDDLSDWVKREADK